VRRGYGLLGAVLPIALLAALAGCQAQKEAAQEASTLKPLALLYGQFTGQHRGQPPKSEAEFKAFIEAKGKPLLASFGVADVESLFTSSRDKKPYVVRYGAVTGAARSRRSAGDRLRARGRRWQAVRGQQLGSGGRDR